MCGITGLFDRNLKHSFNKNLLMEMAETLVHRGPDDAGYYINDKKGVGFGFRRLSIIDLSGGQQPIFNEDNTKVMVCNGEIYNYKELRADLEQRGHQFRSNCDVEVLVHLYEEYGTGFLTMLNGQYAFAIYDITKNEMLLAKDHIGIAPLFYTFQDDVLIFGSEIKAILKHPIVKKRVNLKGLDQILSFPGMVSPTTMFENIHSLKPGHFIHATKDGIIEKEYWDLEYPREGEITYKDDENYYIEGLREELKKAVKYRLNADVPVGYYLSGGIDSSYIGALIHDLFPNNERASFAITFNDKGLNEAKYQRLMASKLSSDHHEFLFDWEDISERLRKAIYHAESPLKETYNTCSLALSQMVKESDIKVVLTGEGADELFAGYVGYRFDKQRTPAIHGSMMNMEGVFEQELRDQLWGDSEFKYEKDFHAFNEIKEAMYAEGAYANFDAFNAVKAGVIDKSKLTLRDSVHKRSYIDFKLRISDHLVADHGDRVGYANSIEARYPFIDINVIEFAKQIPPGLKLKNMEEKYILKRAAQNILPNEIINREKFSFVAPGSPYLVKKNVEWINDILSYETIKRQGYFNPDTIERLKKMYTDDSFSINQTFESDLLMIVLTFGIFLEEFDMPNYA